MICMIQHCCDCSIRVLQTTLYYTTFYKLFGATADSVILCLKLIIQATLLLVKDSTVSSFTCVFSVEIDIVMFVSLINGQVIIHNITTE